MYMYLLVEVCTGIERYRLVCTCVYHVLVHTRTYQYVLVWRKGTGDSTYWYVLVHTSTYWYVLVCAVYNGIYYHAYLWVHAMKAPLGHLERVASGTHCFLVMKLESAGLK